MITKARFSRRQLVGGAAAAVALTGFPMINVGEYRLSAAAGRKYSKRAIDLVRQSLVIDMLGVLKIDMKPEFFSQRLSPQAAAEFKASGITGFHHAAGVGGANPREAALGFIATWQGFAGRNSDVFTLVGNASDLERAKADGKAAVIIGLQNSQHFRGRDDVKYFYQLGQRVSQLTYNSQNLIGSGSTERVDGGVSDFGVSIIEAMNEAGMLIDVSHCGDRTTLDAISLSSKPIAITHSNARALVDHPRVKTDEAIKALAAKGGVMGITGVRNFVSMTEPTTIVHMVNHIEHVAKLVGVDHVGIGSDADLHGYDDMPPAEYAKLKAAYKSSYAFRDKIDTDGFDHPLKMYDLTEELIRRKFTNDEIESILGGNFHRLLKSTWGG